MLIRKKNLIAKLEMLLQNAETMRISGFGKMEKCRELGKVEAYSDLLEDFGVSAMHIKNLLEQAREYAKANLIDWRTY